MAKSSILSLLANELGLKIYKFEAEIGASKSSIEKAIARNSEITDRTIEKIVGRFPQVSRNWLLTGEGSMFNDVNTLAKEASTEKANASTAEHKEFPTLGAKIKRVPLFDTEAIGGNEHNADLAPVTQPTQYIELGDMLRSDSQAALYIFGNSMTPSYPSGCIVGLRLNNDGIIQPGEVYVIEIESNRLLKRLFYSDDGKGYECYSDNTMQFETGPKKGKYMYPPFNVKFESVRRLFDVTGVIKRNRNSSVLQRA